MGMTIAEKMLAAHSGHETVVPGQLIECDIDWVLCHEITTPAALKMLEDRGMARGSTRTGSWRCPITAFRP